MEDGEPENGGKGAAEEEAANVEEDDYNRRTEEDIPDEAPARSHEAAKDEIIQQDAQEEGVKEEARRHGVFGFGTVEDDQQPCAQDEAECDPEDLHQINAENGAQARAATAPRGNGIPRTGEQTGRPIPRTGAALVAHKTTRSRIALFACAAAVVATTFLFPAGAILAVCSAFAVPPAGWAMTTAPSETAIQPPQ